MSFSSDVKKELCRVHVKLAEMRKAEAYGMLLFCRGFSAEDISFRTESGAAAERFASLTAEVTGAVVETRKTLTARKSGAELYKVHLTSQSDCERVFALFGHDAAQTSLRINRANIEFDECMPSFLRGAFLACGSVSSPETEYRLEFGTVHKNLSEDLCKMIREATEINSGRAASPKVLSRRGSYVVYLKDSEDISDLLTLIGAGRASMAVMQVKIEKSRENSINRKINSQIANADRSASASAKQVKAIQKLAESGVLDTLSSELRAAAQLRLDHHVASLKELVELSPVPVSRSGLNHRLAKLVEIAGDITSDSKK